VAASAVANRVAEEVLTLNRAGELVWCAIFRRPEQRP
jgi:hypothetical protein